MVISSRAKIRCNTIQQGFDRRYPLRCYERYKWKLKSGMREETHCSLLYAILDKQHVIRDFRSCITISFRGYTTLAVAFLSGISPLPVIQPCRALDAATLVFYVHRCIRMRSNVTKIGKLLLDYKNTPIGCSSLVLNGTKMIFSALPKLPAKRHSAAPPIFGTLLEACC